MALRVLTDVERQSLQADPAYRLNCEWAARNYAQFWASHNGAGLSDQDRLKWAKDRLLAVDVQLRDLNDEGIVLKCLRVSKAMEVDLNAAPQDSSVIITAMLAQNKFAEVASLYFDLKGEDINFSVGGN